MRERTLLLRSPSDVLRLPLANTERDGVADPDQRVANPDVEDPDRFLLRAVESEESGRYPETNIGSMASRRTPRAAYGYLLACRPNGGRTAS